MGKRKVRRTPRPVLRETPGRQPLRSAIPAAKIGAQPLQKQRRYRREGGAENGGSVALKKKVLLNKETLFGARTNGKQWLARGPNLPGTKAGTAEGD